MEICVGNSVGKVAKKQKKPKKGENMKIFKNKVFIVCIAIALFLSILFAVLSVMGIKNPISDALNIVLMPLRLAANKANEAIEGYGKYFSSLEALYDENISLREEIERLEGEIADGYAAKEENERLRSYLDMKKSYPDYSMLDALIIGRESESYASFLTLDRGSRDGVEVGMPIIVKEGLVGSVCEVGESWCRVRILTEASASVGVYVKRSGESGVLSGDIAESKDAICILKYLSEDADIEVGDRIYTSGEGSVYPGGIFVGEVTEVTTDELLRTKIAKVKATVEPDKLKYLLIVTSFERGDDE